MLLAGHSDSVFNEKLLSAWWRLCTVIELFVFIYYRLIGNCFASVYLNMIYKSCMNMLILDPIWKWNLQIL